MDASGPLRVRWKPLVSGVTILAFSISCGASRGMISAPPMVRAGGPGAAPAKVSAASSAARASSAPRVGSAATSASSSPPVMSPGTSSAASKGPAASPSIPSIATTKPIRYRLRISNNPVDPANAFRCYGDCRQAPTEDALIKCLSRCPGFEVTEGAVCSKDEGIPRSFCIDRRPAKKTSEPDAGVVVLTVMLDVALIFALANMCSSSIGCSPYYYYGPY